MTYETIDHFLRNSLGDDDYGNYSEALDDAIHEAVLQERERCLNCYSPDDTVHDYQAKIRGGL